MKKVLTALAAVSSIFFGMLALAPTASAAGYGCAGSQIDSYPMYATGGTQFGTVFLYYDSSTGKNCAVTVATAAGGYGVSKLMHIEIVKCSQTVDTGSCTGVDSVVDHDYYQYYAGPRSINAAGHCIAVTGQITYNGKYAGAFDIGHCG
ncbi:hypothetical protein [Streptomyces sp. NBC_00564]|uniref:hypothetical protein n=1 Tax=Streptomyces sp. NBC_00564 TaxID=2903663 RepID=UPI00352F2169|nr:hypothetical protein OG256_23025 [Streptomyces sp. NBC_00564]